MKVVALTFTDAFDGTGGWHTFKEGREMVEQEFVKATARVFGVVITEDEDKISLAQVWMFNEKEDSDGDCIRGIFTVPKVWVRDIEVLKDYGEGTV